MDEWTYKEIEYIKVRLENVERIIGEKYPEYLVENENPKTENSKEEYKPENRKA